MFDAILSSMMSYTARAPNMLVGRFLVSVNPQVVLGVAASLCCAGPNTISPQEGAELIAQVCSQMEHEGLSREEAVQRVVEPYVKERCFLPGLGHPDFKQTDPRTARLWELAARWGFLGEKVAIFEAIRKAYLEGTGRKQLPINIDGASEEDACKLTEEEQATVWAGIPVTQVRAFESPYFEKYNTSLLRVMICGGAPVPPKSGKKM